MSDMSPKRIELKLQSVHQLFNSMDPAPFHERDLDDDAEIDIYLYRWWPIFELGRVYRKLSQIPIEVSLP